MGGLVDPAIPTVGGSSGVLPPPQTGVGVENRSARAESAIRAVGAHPGDGAQHDLRVHLAQPIESDAQPVQIAAAHPLDHRVARSREIQKRLFPLGRAQVECDRFLAAIPPQVHERRAVRIADRPVAAHPHGITEGTGFDLDHLGAQIGQMPAQ